jgi:hypothetical protein
MPEHSVLRKAERGSDCAEFFAEARRLGASNYSHQDFPPDGLVLAITCGVLERFRSKVVSYERFAGSPLFFNSQAALITLDVEPLQA